MRRRIYFGNRRIPLRSVTNFAASVRRSNGFSLIELMVVISIISLLLSLGLPAIHSAREAARRFQCSNNIKQLGLALQQHVSIYQAFPGNGGYLPGASLKSKSGETFVPSTDDLYDGNHYDWGVGVPGGGPTKQLGSWAFSVLPYIEQGNAQSEMAVEVRQPLFLCPSRARPEPAPTVDDSYGNDVTGGWAWAKTDYCGNARMMPNFPRYMRVAELTDGLSNTYAIGEKSFDPKVHVATTWYWDEPIFSGGSKGTARAGLLILPDRPGIAFRENWGAPHAGGAIFGNADGSTRLVNVGIDHEAMRSLLTPNGGEVVTLDGE